MIFTLSLALLCSALDAGQHGVPFGTHGVGALPVWEQYRRNELTGSAMFPLMTMARDGGLLMFDGVRQGCDVTGCASQTPGIFISRVPGLHSPAFSPVLFRSAAPVPSFDVRLSLAEQEPDAGLRSFVAAGGGDLGPRMDPYFALGADGLSIHLAVEPEPSGLKLILQQATCMEAENGLKEELRVDRRNEFTTPFTVIAPRDAELEWGLVDGGAGLLDFVVFADRVSVMRWPVPASRLLSCDNLSDGGFSDGALDLTRLVPVLYVGLGSFADTMTQATLVMGFAGYAPRFIAAPTAGIVGQPLSLERGFFFEDGGLVKSVGTPLTLRVESPTNVSQQSSQPGLSASGTSVSSFTPMTPGLHRLSLELAGPDVAIEHFFVVTASDAGPGDAGSPDDAGVLTDAGTSGDAGLPPDAGDGSDAGILTDAGTSGDAGSATDAGVSGDGGVAPERRELSVGCGCWHADVEAVSLSVMLLWLVRRRRRS